LISWPSRASLCPARGTRSQRRHDDGSTIRRGGRAQATRDDDRRRASAALLGDRRSRGAQPQPRVPGPADPVDASGRRVRRAERAGRGAGFRSSEQLGCRWPNNMVALGRFERLQLDA
jgi:hypothetical protein